MSIFNSSYGSFSVLQSLGCRGDWLWAYCAVFLSFVSLPLLPVFFFLIWGAEWFASVDVSIDADQHRVFADLEWGAIWTCLVMRTWTIEPELPLLTPNSTIDERTNTAYSGGGRGGCSTLCPLCLSIGGKSSNGRHITHLLPKRSCSATVPIFKLTPASTQ